MNQPKFKFGDKVFYKNATTPKPFKVVIISLLQGRYYYGKDPESTLGYEEDSLELYQESQKKKLYAYSQMALVHGSVCEHIFKEFKFANFDVAKFSGFNRDPEYDIEYAGKVWVSDR